MVSVSGLTRSIYPFFPKKQLLEIAVHIIYEKYDKSSFYHLPGKSESKICKGLTGKMRTTMSQLGAWLLLLLSYLLQGKIFFFFFSALQKQSACFILRCVECEEKCGTLLNILLISISFLC